MKKTLASLLSAATIALTLAASATDVSAQWRAERGAGEAGDGVGGPALPPASSAAPLSPEPSLRPGRQGM